jgi:hypothetical protein
MHRKSKAVLLGALTSCALLASLSRSFAGNPQITVSVYDDVRVPSDTLARAEEQATKIFLRAGLDVNWLDCSPTNSARCAAAFEIDNPFHLILRITPNVASSTSDAAFGVAYLATDGTGRYGDVFWKRAQDLQANSKVDLALILASVMAHEVGHLLLGSNAHAISGIMQAHWQPSELRHISMGSLLFLPEQGKRMRARVTQREQGKSFSYQKIYQAPPCPEH